MKTLSFIALLLTGFVNFAQAETSTTPSLGEHLNSLHKKFRNYLNEDAERRRNIDKAQARVVVPGAKPEIIIRRSGIGSNRYPYFADGILFNGQRITTGDLIPRAIELFGNDFRTRDSFYTWDSLGISVHTYIPNAVFEARTQNIESLLKDPKAKRIRSISINLNPTPQGMPTSPSKPSHTFSGYLDLDGAGIDSDTKIWEVRALVDRTGLAGAAPYIICIEGRLICQVQSFGSERSDEVSFWTDKDHANGKIYSVTYSFR